MHSTKTHFWYASSIIPEGLPDVGDVNTSCRYTSASSHCRRAIYTIAPIRKYSCTSTTSSLPVRPEFSVRKLLLSVCGEHANGPSMVVVVALVPGKLYMTFSSTGSASRYERVARQSSMKKRWFVVSVPPVGSRRRIAEQMALTACVR